MDHVNNPHLESFLQKIEEKLGDMPPTRRLEVLTETREHLQALVAARMADGFDEETAWNKALADFGEAEEIGGALAAEWKRSPRYETEGAPLSKQEQTRKIAGTIVAMGAFYSLILWAMPWLMARHIAGFALLALLPFCFGMGHWRWRKNGGQYTPSIIATQVFSILNGVTAAMYVQFQSQLRGTWVATAFLFWFGGGMIVVCLSLALWQKREAKKLHPWKTMPRYFKSPIAAEEEYRMSPLLGAVAGTTMGCIGLLWMGWQFFGFAIALTGCAVVIAFSYLFYRLVRV